MRDYYLWTWYVRVAKNEKIEQAGDSPLGGQLPTQEKKKLNRPQISLKEVARKQKKSRTKWLQPEKCFNRLTPNIFTTTESWNLIEPEAHLPPHTKKSDSIKR